MDETEDHEPGVGSVLGSTVKLTTGVASNTSETQVEGVVEGVGGGNNGACVGGDVMVEVLHSEALVDGVRKHNGQVGGGELGVGVKGRNLGDGGDGVSAVLQDHVDEDRVVESGVERGVERELGDEGRVTETESAGGGNEMQEDSVSRNVQLRMNDGIENGIQHCPLRIMLKADGNNDDNDDNVVEIVDAEKKEGEVLGVLVVDCASVNSKSTIKEKNVLEKGDEEAADALNVVSVGVTSRSEDELPDEVEDQRYGGRQDTFSIDMHAIEGVGQFGSDMDDNQEVQQYVDISDQVELPEAEEEDDDPQSDSMESQSDGGNEDYEGHTAHQRTHLPDQSFVEDVDQGNNHVPETTLVEESAMIDIAQDGSEMEDSEEGQEEAGISEEMDSPDEAEVDEELGSDSAKSRSKGEKNAGCGHANSGNLVKDCRVSYQLPLENEDEFSMSDLVWGKVKSHPWWPGQIFHPFDSSEKAKKYIRKDCYLVAYFGDKSFAWNDGSVLKPFFKHFSQEEKQSNSESFQNAVSCALEEVSRRVELGLACSCISEEVYDKIKYQKVDNAGIRRESSKREGVDWSTGVDYFQPDKLVQYVKALALSPTNGASKLDLVIVKAQLLAFNRLKGCDELPDFQYYDGLMECEDETPLLAEHGETDLVDSVAGGDSKMRLKGPHKRKHDLKDIVYQRRREKSIPELMGESIYYFDADFDSPEEDDHMLNSPASGTRRKALAYVADDFTGQQSTKTISVAKVSNAASPNPQQSFKVGECIRRVASQLTGSSSIMKISSDGNNGQQPTGDADEVSDPPDDSLPEEKVAPKEVSTDEVLSQLHLSARDPMKGYSFLADVISFFTEFRNMAVSTQRQIMRKGSGRKRKSSVPATGAPETFEFDIKNDSYWTDMVVQNNSEAKPSKRGRKRKEDRLPSGDTEKPLKSNPRKYTRKKQYFHGNRESVAEIPPGTEKQLEQLSTGPTELTLNFNEGGCIPSEVNLNKMFRRFGPLKESETEIDVQSCRAKVVFKKRSDAEVAYSSAAMFNIFGSTLVNYQLNYIPTVPIGSVPLAPTVGQDDAP